MPQQTFTLLCHRDMPMAMITLPKIIHFLEPSQNLVIVDDGSLTVEDIFTLKKLSPIVRIITRHEREDYILDAIGNRPNCKQYREEFPLAFKLIDIPLLAGKDSHRYTFTDTDIIYLKNCKNYFNQCVNTYLRTDAIKLSVKLQNAFLKYKWEIPLRFNSGYFSYDTRSFDLDFIEYFLGLPDVRNSPWLSEQTCWALLFNKSGPSHCPLEEQFVCRENFLGPTEKTLAIHLIGKLKSKAKEWSIPNSQFLNHGNEALFETGRNVHFVDWLNKSALRLYKKFENPFFNS